MNKKVIKSCCLIMRQIKVVVRASIVLLFYIMSPFCPWNNAIEVQVMDKLATFLQKAPFLVNIKLFIISGILYFIYNVLTSIGFMSLNNSQKAIKWKNLILEVVVWITAYYSVKHFLNDYMIHFIIVFSIIYGYIHYKRNKELYIKLLKKKKGEGDEKDY